MTNINGIPTMVQTVQQELTTQVPALTEAYIDLRTLLFSSYPKATHTVINPRMKANRALQDTLS